MSCFVECKCQQRQDIYAASVWQSESHLFCRQTPAARKEPRHCLTRYCFVNAGFDHSALRLLHMTPAGTRPAAVHCSSPAKIWVGSWLSAATATLPAAFAVAASPSHLPHVPGSSHTFCPFVPKCPEDNAETRKQASWGCHNPQKWPPKNSSKFIKNH